MSWIDGILQGRTIRYFLSAVAIYLAWQIWLNARFYGTDWPCWDYMLISGFLAFILAVSLATDINRRLNHAIDQLRLNNALVLTEDGVKRIKLAMTQRGRSIEFWSGLAIGSLIFGSYVWVFGALALQIWRLWNAGALPEGGTALIELGIFTAISAASAVIAGLFFGRLTHYGTLANVLSTEEAGLRITPGHFDGACGLKPIGDFYLYQALLLAIPILWLGAFWAWIIPTYKDVICSVTGQPQPFFREWRGPFFIQWLVVLGYFHLAFIRPFFALRSRIRDAKQTLDLEERPRLERAIYDLQGRLAAAPGHGEVAAEEIDRLSRRLWSIRTMTDWPMDPLTLAKYRSVVLGEVILPLGAAAITSSGLADGSPLAGWLQTWAGAGR